MSDDNAGALFVYWRAEVDGARRTDDADASIWDEHAFLARYGSSGDLLNRVAHLEGLIGWWNTRGPLHPEEDTEAIAGLRSAADRLENLRQRAAHVEARLLTRGYEFDSASRTLKACREVGPNGQKKRGRVSTLASDAIVLACRWLFERGYPESNSVELRARIREELSTTFHPDLLTDTKIESAVNSHIKNPDRH